MHATLLGVPAAQARIAQVQSSLVAAASPAARAGAEVVEQDARARIEASPSILSGDLLDSIEVLEADSGSTGAAWDIGTDLEYAVFVEFGTSVMAAEPFLRPALDEGEGPAVAAQAAVFRAAIGA